MQQRKTLNNNDFFFHLKTKLNKSEASLTTHYSKSPHTRRNKKLMEQTEGSVWSKHKNWYREALPAGFEYGPTLSCWWPCGGGWEHEKAGWQCGERTYTPQHQKEKHASRERERARANTYARKAALRPLTVWVVVSGERADALSRAVQLAIHEGFARSTSGACVRARGEKVWVEMFFETIWISYTLHRINKKSWISLKRYVNRFWQFYPMFSCFKWNQNQAPCISMKY